MTLYFPQIQFHSYLKCGPKAPPINCHSQTLQTPDDLTIVYTVQALQLSTGPPTSLQYSVWLLTHKALLTAAA